MSTVTVVGMGFVGIPLSLAFDGAGHEVTGYDIDRERVVSLRDGVDPTAEVDGETLADCSVTFTYDATVLEDSDYVLITVPTPTDEWQSPDPRAIESAAGVVGENLQPGATVVLESTVYPGATREVLVPALEARNGLEAGVDFGVAYSPERIAPGPPQPEHLVGTSKLVGALTASTLEDVHALYDDVLEASVHRVPSVETAEAAKCIENVQRDVNIALMNEFVMGCNRIDVDVDPHAVLEAARTKPAFHEYRPGLVGGHCLPVDPHFLISRFNRDGFNPDIVEAARRTNESFAEFVATSVVKGVGSATTGSETALGDGGEQTALRQGDRPIDVLVLGFSYKPNVSDCRNEALDRMLAELRSYGTTVHGHDPVVGSAVVNREFGIRTVSEPELPEYDAIVVTTLHEEFRDLDIAPLHASEDGPFVLDLTEHFVDGPLVEAEVPHVR